MICAGGVQTKGGGLVCYQVEWIGMDGQDMDRLVRFYVTFVDMFVCEEKK